MSSLVASALVSTRMSASRSSSSSLIRRTLSQVSRMQRCNLAARVRASCGQAVPSVLTTSRRPRVGTRSGAVSTMLRNEAADIRGEWIDALLGHEGGSKSRGATTYLKRIGVANLAKTMAALEYAPAVNAAAGRLVGVEAKTAKRPKARERG